MCSQFKVLFIIAVKELLFLEATQHRGHAPELLLFFFPPFPPEALFLLDCNKAVNTAYQEKEVLPKSVYWGYFPNGMRIRPKLEKEFLVTNEQIQENA